MDFRFRLYFYFIQKPMMHYYFLYQVLHQWFGELHLVLQGHPVMMGSSALLGSVLVEHNLYSFHMWSVWRDSSRLLRSRGPKHYFRKSIDLMKYAQQNLKKWKKSPSAYSKLNCSENLLLNNGRFQYSGSKKQFWLIFERCLSLKL